MTGGKGRDFHSPKEREAAVPVITQRRDLCGKIKSEAGRLAEPRRFMTGSGSADFHCQLHQQCGATRAEEKPVVNLDLEAIA